METRQFLLDSPNQRQPQIDNKMASYCLAYGCDSKEPPSFANPDVCTSAGLVANAYGKFKTHFWLDRILIWLTVIIPIAQASLLILLNALFGVARCMPKGKFEADQSINRFSDDFIDRACGLQLTTDILRGEPGGSVTSEAFHSVQLQHECYPFILLMVSLFMLAPHYFYHRLIDKTARRDLCLIRSELHSFRRAVGRELNYLQTISATSLDGVLPTTTTMFSQGQTFPTSPTWAVVTNRTAGTTNPCQDQNSGLTNAATVGDASLLSNTPAPTVIPVTNQQSHQQQSATLGHNRTGLFTANHTLETPQNVINLNCGDADFSAPGLLDLPCFHACHADWSLNTYLSAWQNTDFFWRRYLAKHAVLAAFQFIVATSLFILIGLSHGAPFIALFRCELGMLQSNTPMVCMLHTTFILNISAISWTLLVITGLGLQAVFFYTNFLLCLGDAAKHAARYFGVTNKPATFIQGLDETGRCFFADYIRLMAYTAFRETKCEIRELSVSYAPELYRTDFHFISMLCSENAHMFPDAIHIHFWTERYARLCRRQFRRPFWAIRRGSLGHLVRCEDLSMKFNFSKIRVKVEVNDFGF